MLVLAGVLLFWGGGERTQKPATFEIAQGLVRLRVGR